MKAPLAVAEHILEWDTEPRLTAVITEPKRPSGVRPTFVFLNAGVIHRVGPHRLHVDLARSLALMDFPSVRFDVSGLGDSDARRDGLSYHDSRIIETRQVMDRLATRSHTGRFVLCGICSGADHAFQVATVDDRVVGAVLLDGYTYRTHGYYVRRFGRNLFRWRSWANVLTGKHPAWRRLASWARARRPTSEPGSNGEGFVMYSPPRDQVELALQHLLRRGVRLLFIFTGGVQGNYNYAGQLGDMFPSVRSDHTIRTDYWPDVNHTYTLLSHQKRLNQALSEWAASCWPVEAPR
jgi:hypothetical protein